MTGKRNNWIDIARTAAILGVVLQHARGWLYSSDLIFRCLLFAVGLFILIGGYNIMGSYNRHNSVKVVDKLLAIFIPYFIATFIYCLYAIHPFDIMQFFDRLIHFDAMAPLYYVAAYMQLVIITPVLIKLLDLCEGRFRLLKLAALWAVIVLISYLTTNHTNILDIILGGGNLFAGHWLMFWFAGLCMGRYAPTSCGKKAGTAVLAADTVLLLAWHYLFVLKDMNADLPAIFNGDQVLITWAHAAEIVLIFIWFYVASLLFGDRFDVVTKPLGYLGRNSLYIFLYHVMFLEIYVTYFFTYLLNRNGRLNQILLILFILGCPLLCGYVAETAGKTFKKLIKGRKKVVD